MENHYVFSIEKWKEWRERVGAYGENKGLPEWVVWCEGLTAKEMENKYGCGTCQIWMVNLRNEKIKDMLK